MPILDIAEEGRLKPMAGLIVLAAMAYPKKTEEEKRTQFLASMDAAQLVRILEMGISPLPPPLEAWVQANAMRLLPIVRESPTPDRIQLKAGRNARHAWVAGVVLKDLLAASIHHPEAEANVEKVIFALGQKFKARPSAGPRPITGPDAVRKYWKHFRTVSHLHLAMRYLEPAHRQPTREERADIFDKGLPKVLGLAEKFRREAVEKGILTSEESWSVPEGVELELVDEDIDRVVPGLPDSILDSIRAYKPQYANY